MNHLEDALREAFGSDLDPRNGPTAAGVRQAVRRRRTTRTVAAATAAVALVAVSAAALGLRDDRDRSPAPTPRPTQTVTEDWGRPLTSAGEVRVGGGALYATSSDPSCTCSVLLRRDGDRWTELHRFPVEFIDRLSLTPDGRHGWAAASGLVWSTHDGGSTWGKVQLPAEADPAIGDSYVLDASSSYAWVVNLGSDVLRRSPVDHDDFQRFAVPGDSGVPSVDTRLWDVAVVGDSVIADLAPTDEGNVTSEPKVADRDGKAWRALPRPCTGDTHLLPTDDAVFVICPDAGQPEATIYRWRPGDDGFTGFSNVELPPGTDVMPVSSDKVLVLGTHDLLVSGQGSREVDLGLSEDAFVASTATLDGGLYLATSEGLFASLDDGRTWHRI